MRLLGWVLKRIEVVNKTQRDNAVRTERCRLCEPKGSSLRSCAAVFLPQTKSPVRGYSNCSQSTQAVVFCRATRVDEDRKHYRALGKAVKTMMDTHTDTAYLS